MTIPLHELLEQRFGVDEDEFAAALEEFADRAGPLAIIDVRPADYFGEAQKSTLRRLGATLEPLQPTDLGPIAGLAAAHAELGSKSMTVAEAARYLRVDQSRIRQRIYGRSLYAFKHRAGWLIPAFQFLDGELVPGIGSVVSNLSPALHPVTVTRWFTTPDPDLVLTDEAVSPIIWLATGGTADVVAALALSVDQL